MGNNDITVRRDIYRYLWYGQLRYYITVKPEIFTTFLFSRLSRITKIREIKKSGKILPFFKSDNEVWGV